MGMRSSIVVSRSVINPMVNENTTAIRKGYNVKRVPRGSARNAALVEAALDLHNAAVDANVTPQKRKEMAETFDAKRSKAKRARIDDVLETTKNAPEKAPNKHMRKTGDDHTPTVQGFVNFGKLRATQHRAFIVEELHRRGNTSATVKTPWNKLRQALAEDPNSQSNGTKVFFKPLTSHFDALLGNNQA